MSQLRVVACAQSVRVVDDHVNAFGTTARARQCRHDHSVWIISEHRDSAAGHQFLMAHDGDPYQGWLELHTELSHIAARRGPWHFLISTRDFGKRANWS